MWVAPHIFNHIFFLLQLNCCFALLLLSSLLCFRAGYELPSSAVSVSNPAVILALHNNSAAYLIMLFPGLFPAIQNSKQSFFFLSQSFINYKVKWRHFESSCHTTQIFFRRTPDLDEIIFTDNEFSTSQCKLLQRWIT